MNSELNLNRTTILWALVALLLLAGIVALVLSFGNADAAPEEVNAIYTNAAATLEAQQLTLAASQPTQTPTATLTVTPFVTNTPFVTLTLPSLPVLASPTSGVVSGAVGCDNSLFVADVTVPDKTTMTPGQAFTKTWRLQNTGTCPWTTAYKVTFLSGNAMGGQPTALTTTVNPGQNGDVSVAMVAPTTPGEAIGYWKLSNANGQQFGTSFYVQIMVAGSASTSTSTSPSATPVTPSPTTQPTEPTPTEESSGG
jgi:hypothetical protein